MRRRHLLIGTLASGLALSALTACGGGGLESDDPKGFEACELFETFRSDTDKGAEEQIVAFGAVGLAAAEATTEGIREAAEPLLDDATLKKMRETNPKTEQIYMIDRDEFPAVCAKAGYKFD